MGDPDAVDRDQTEAALVQIAAELTAIRQLLQTEFGDAVADQSDTPTPEYECRCGATFETATGAREHTRAEHGAPNGAEDDLLTGL